MDMNIKPDALAADDLEAMRACAAREAAMRERVYPKQIAAGRMTPEMADEELLQMKTIAALLTYLRDKAAGVREFDFGS
jgi:hypothetical protein